VTHENFDWTVADSDPVTRSPVWGVKCGVCKELVRVPNTDSMSSDAHEAKRIEIALKHRCKGPTKGRVSAIDR
jgi:hypothetical protein